MSLKALDEAFAVRADEAWMDVPGVPGMTIKLRTNTSKEVRTLQLKQAKSAAKIYRAKQDLTLGQMDARAIELLAQAMIVDWRGFTQADGSPLPCTPENVTALMEKYISLRDACISFASELENFQAEAVEALGKTAAPSSASSSAPMASA